MSGKRVGYLDFLRGAAICLVVMLHAIAPYVTDVSLYGSATWYGCIVLNEFCRMGVPLFFMISGYLLLSVSREETVVGFYKKRLPKLVVPLLIWNVVYYLFSYSAVHYSVREFFSLLINNGTSYHLWYIYALAGVYLLLPFIKKMLAHCGLTECLVLLAVLTWNTTLQPLLNIVTPLYFNLIGSQSAGYLGYVLLGYIIGRYDIGKRWQIAIYALGAAGAVFGIYGNIAMSGGDGLRLISNGGFTINHYLAAAAVFCFARYNLADAKNAAVSVLAKHSYGIFWVHALVLTVVTRHLSLPRAWMQIAAAFAVAMASSLAASVLYDRGKRLVIK